LINILGRYDEKTKGLFFNETRCIVHPAIKSPVNVLLYTILSYYQVFHYRLGVLCSVNGFSMLAHTLVLCFWGLKSCSRLTSYLITIILLSVGSYVDVSSIFDKFTDDVSNR